jgi:hypothetical protein
MEQKKLNRIIDIIREQMVTGSTGAAAGFSASSDPKGPTAGFDPLMGTKRRKGPQIKLPPGSRKRWTGENNK